MMLSTVKFYQEFPDEKSCQNHLKSSREQQGVYCKKCGSKEHYWLKSKKQWECKKCQFRTTLTSGTMFHASNIKLFYWYQVIYFMNATQKSISAKEMQKKLGFNRYEPVWYMMHKIRLTMSSINSEIDYKNETYLKRLSLMNRKPTTKNFVENFFVGSPKKRSEVILIKDKSEQSQNKIRFKIFPNSTEYMNEEQYSQVVYSTMLIENAGISHRRVFFRKKIQLLSVFNDLKEKKSRWIKNMIKNLKGVIYTIHHGVSEKYLQLYLDEFSFKYNSKKVLNRWSEIIFKGLRFYW